MIIGLDTGFFIRLLQGHDRAVGVWTRVVRGEASAALSCISLYELDRQGLRGLVPKGDADLLIRELPHACRVVWIRGPELLRRAARLGHGNGLAMADSIILACLIEAEAEEIHTTDSDFGVYAGGPRIVMH